MLIANACLRPRHGAGGPCTFRTDNTKYHLCIRGYKTNSEYIPFTSIFVYNIIIVVKS